MFVKVFEYFFATLGAGVLQGYFGVYTARGGCGRVVFSGVALRACLYPRLVGAYPHPICFNALMLRGVVCDCWTKLADCRLGICAVQSIFLDTCGLLSKFAIPLKIHAPLFNGVMDCWNQCE